MNAKTLQSLYDSMPIAFQNLACSIKGAVNYWRRYNKRFHQYLDWLKETEWWEEEKIGAYQDEQIQQIVRNAYENVPFYRKWFDQNGVKPEYIQTQKDLTKLPILTKSVVRENQKQMVSRQKGQCPQIKLLTSGTTGTPLEIITTRQGIAYQWAIWWRHRSRFGLHLGDSCLSFGARVAVPSDQNKPPYWRNNIVGNQTYLATYHMTPEKLPDIVKWLNRTHFDFFTGYPSAIFVLANYLLEHNINLKCKPKYIVCGADALTSAFESRIQRAFQVPVTEQYGMTEFAGNMAKCPYGKFHLDFECCVVETIPLNKDNPNYVKLLFTGWGNPMMPFIRYDVGDYALVSRGKCPCGRQSLCFERIEGRTEDYVRTPDGRMVIGMNQVLEFAPGAKEIQIYQHQLDEIEFRIVPGNNFNESDEQALLRETRKRVADQLRVKFVLVDSIPRTVSGKFRAVISDVPGKTAEENHLKTLIEQ